MTPPATAANRSSNRSVPGTRRTPVRHPRRISGPAGPARSGALAAAVAVPAPGTALPRRRPARPTVEPRRRRARERTRRSVQGAPGIALRAVDAFESVSSSAFLDRLIRGRAWIGLLAFALIGIVAMQLFVLQLNTGIGRTLTRTATLQRENAQLGIEDSTSSAEGRIASLAAATGMTLAPVGSGHFVATSPADLARAAAALSAPIRTAASGAGETSGGESAASAATSAGSATSTGAASETSTEAKTEATTAEAPASTGSSETSGSSESSGASSGSGG
jgi:hypothetical protein